MHERHGVAPRRVVRVPVAAPRRRAGSGRGRRLRVASKRVRRMPGVGRRVRTSSLGLQGGLGRAGGVGPVDPHPQKDPGDLALPATLRRHVRDRRPVGRSPDRGDPRRDHRGSGVLAPHDGPGASPARFRSDSRLRARCGRGTRRRKRGRPGASPGRSAGRSEARGASREDAAARAGAQGRTGLCGRAARRSPRQRGRGEGVARDPRSPGPSRRLAAHLGGCEGSSRQPARPGTDRFGSRRRRGPRGGLGRRVALRSPDDSGHRRPGDGARSRRLPVRRAPGCAPRSGVRPARRERRTSPRGRDAADRERSSSRTRPPTPLRLPRLRTRPTSSCASWYSIPATARGVWRSRCTEARPQSITSTAAPRTSPRLTRRSASLASSSGWLSIRATTGIRLASSRNSSASFRVKFITLRTARSP